MCVTRTYPPLAISILWVGAALGAVALFAVSAEEGHGSHPLESRSLGTVVNATNADGSRTAWPKVQSDPQQAIEELQKKVRLLEAEMAALKRQYRSP